MVRSGFIVPYDATTSPMRSRRPYGSGTAEGEQASSFSSTRDSTLILFDTIRETLPPKEEEEEEKDRIESSNSRPRFLLLFSFLFDVSSLLSCSLDEENSFQRPVIY